MNVAFHFNADHEIFDGFYGLPIQRLLFKALRAEGAPSLNTEVSSGDILLLDLTSSALHISRRAALDEVFRLWISPQHKRWSPMTLSRTPDVTVYAAHLTNINLADAEYLHQQLSDHVAYLGAMEIDPGLAIHQYLYDRGLIDLARLEGETVHLISPDEDNLDTNMKGILEDLGFDVDFEIRFGFGI